MNRFLAAARTAEGDEVFFFYAFAICTGLRAGELAALRWDAIDLNRRLITVSRSFATTTKANDVRYVPILDPLLPLLQTRKLQSRGAFVFTNNKGKMFASSDRIFQEVLHRVLAAGRFPAITQGGKPVRYITFPGLRHTFASHWVMNGGDLFKLQKILGHKNVQMTMRYAHLAPDAFAQDYGRIPTAPTCTPDAAPAPLARRA